MLTGVVYVSAECAPAAPDGTHACTLCAPRYMSASARLTRAPPAPGYHHLAPINTRFTPRRHAVRADEAQRRFD